MSRGGSACIGQCPRKSGFMPLQALSAGSNCLAVPRRHFTSGIWGVRPCERARMLARPLQASPCYGARWGRATPGERLGSEHGPLGRALTHAARALRSSSTSRARRTRCAQGVPAMTRMSVPVGRSRPLACAVWKDTARVRPFQSSPGQSRDPIWKTPAGTGVAFRHQSCQARGTHGG